MIKTKLLEPKLKYANVPWKTIKPTVYTKKNQSGAHSSLPSFQSKPSPNLRSFPGISKNNEMFTDDELHEISLTMQEDEKGEHPVIRVPSRLDNIKTSKIDIVGTGDNKKNSSQMYTIKAPSIHTTPGVSQSESLISLKEDSDEEFPEVLTERASTFADDDRWDKAYKPQPITTTEIKDQVWNFARVEHEDPIVQLKSNPFRASIVDGHAQIRNTYGHKVLIKAIKSTITPEELPSMTTISQQPITSCFCATKLKEFYDNQMVPAPTFLDRE